MRHPAVLLVVYASLVSCLVPGRPSLLPGRPLSVRRSDGIVMDEVTVEVRRTESGSLGLELDTDNTIATNSGQPGLQVGDVVLAINGELLNGRPAATVLQPADTYTFIVRRDRAAAAAALEKILLKLTIDAEGDDSTSLWSNLLRFDDLPEQDAGSAMGLVEGMENGAEPPADQVRRHSCLDVGASACARVRRTHALDRHRALADAGPFGQARRLLAAATDERRRLRHGGAHRLWQCAVLYGRRTLSAVRVDG